MTSRVSATPLQALVVGSNGQDGSYLTELLLARGYAVTGMARQASSRFVRHPGLRHLAIDLADGKALEAALDALHPDRIFYVAAVTGAAGFPYEDRWQEALSVNIGSVHVCLEYLRRKEPSARLFFASSLKAFGTRPPPVIDESTPRQSNCLYSITKNAADDLIRYYRQTHSLHATTGYLFNHDSPRRSPEYFLPKIATAVADCLKGEPTGASIRTLNFACDWGSSREYMEIAIDFLETDAAEDLVIATGRSWNAAALVETLFAAAGGRWQDFLRVHDPMAAIAPEAPRADIGRLKARLGREPRTTAPEVVAWMVEQNHGVRLSLQTALQPS